jgi:hypothetical protein
MVSEGVQAEEIRIIEIAVHIGAEHASFPVQPDITIGAIKTESLSKLKIVPDPNIDYILQYEGRDLNDNTETLRALLHNKLRKEVTFHLKKRPKGGKARD